MFAFLSIFEPTSKDHTHRFSFVPMRLDFDIHLPNFGHLRLSSVELGADLGLSLGTLGTEEWTGATSSHVEVERSVTAITAGASVAVTRGTVKLGAGWARRMWPLPRQGLVLEQRLTSFLTWRPSGRRWLVELEGFAARSTVFQVAQDRTEWIGGAELRWAHALGRWLQVGLSAEAARSYYAGPVTSESPEIDGTPRFSLRAMGFVAAQLQSAE